MQQPPNPWQFLETAVLCALLAWLAWVCLGCTADAEPECRLVPGSPDEVLTVCDVTPTNQDRCRQAEAVITNFHVSPEATTLAKARAADIPFPLWLQEYAEKERTLKNLRNIICQPLTATARANVSPTAPATATTIPTSQISTHTPSPSATATSASSAPTPTNDPPQGGVTATHRSHAPEPMGSTPSPASTARIEKSPSVPTGTMVATAIDVGSTPISATSSPHPPSATVERRIVNPQGAGSNPAGGATFLDQVDSYLAIAASISLSLSIIAGAWYTIRRRKERND